MIEFKFIYILIFKKVFYPNPNRNLSIMTEMRTTFLFKDPSIITNFDTDNESICMTWLVHQQSSNFFDTSFQVSAEVLCMFVNHLHHKYSIIRNGHYLAIFQLEETDRENFSHPCPLAFQYGHQVWGFTIVLKMRCFNCKRNDLPVQRYLILIFV